MKKILALICVFLMLNTVAYAKEFKDMVFESHWAYNALQYACENGFIQGFDDGTIRPDEPLTRAQMAAIIVRAYGDGNKADISEFEDVPKTAWYYDAFCEAVDMKLFQGDGTNHLYPTNNITREEAFVVIGRLLQLNSSESSTKFKDDLNIAAWSKGYIKALFEKGYVSGDDENCINPKGEITRAEFSQLIYNINNRQDNQSQNTSKTDTKTNTSSGSGSGAGNSPNISSPTENENGDIDESVPFDGDSYMDDIFND